MPEFLGGIDYKINENSILHPDIALTCKETNDTYLAKTPEAIVEIISKTTAKRDEVYKFKLYETEKVNYYIIIYPDDLRAKVHKLEGKEYDKQGDFSSEKYIFQETTRKVELDFEKVFKRFKKR